MKRIVMIGVVAGVAMVSLLNAQSPTAGRGNAATRRPFEKFTVEGQPVDKRPPELDTDHPVFPGQTHAPYHKTTDVAVTTIASGLDTPWGVELLPSGRFLITEKAGRLRILDKDQAVILRGRVESEMKARSSSRSAQEPPQLFHATQSEAGGLVAQTPDRLRHYFADWDGVDRGPLDDWRFGRNDLEPAAVSLVPLIGSVLAWLNVQEGVRFVRMSGSGSTCFARACRWIR